MQAVTTVGRASRLRSGPRGRSWGCKGGRSKAQACVLVLPCATVAEASMASMRTLGMSGKAEMSTVLRRGRQVIELNLRGRVDAHDGQFAGCRPTGIHVEFEMCAPWVSGTGRSPAVLYTAGLDWTGCSTEWRGKGWTDSGRGNYPGHDGRRERTRA
jgi:hypothetical protein